MHAVVPCSLMITCRVIRSWCEFWAEIWQY